VFKVHWCVEDYVIKEKWFDYFMFRTLRWNFRLLIYSLLLTGCATIPPENGGDVSPDDMAVITDSYWGSFRYSKAGIWGIDGTALNFTERVKIPPGRHTVKVYCAHGYGLGSQLYASMRSVEFNAEPGHKYQVKCSKERGSWVEDTATSQVVSTESSTQLESVEAISQTAERGDADAQLQFYYVNPGSPEGLRWLCRSAEQGNPHAQNEVARLYRQGVGSVEKDLRRAYVWYKFAVQNGHEEYQWKLEEVTESLTSEQMAEAEKILANWQPGQCERELATGGPDH
jgi:hypothetical protein